MKNWSITSSIVVASVFCVLAGARARAEQPSFPADADSLSRSVQRELDLLRQRTTELETMIRANEDATRTIIRQSFAERGSQINDFVVFGGTLEVVVGWADDFDGVDESFIQLDTAELDFEVQVNDWTLGSIIFEYVGGTDFLFPTTEEDEVAIDGVNIDTAFITLGNPQRSPLLGMFGRMIVPFGISTGDPVADVLTLEDPLTVEVFETKEDAILLGFEILSPRPKPWSPTTRTTPITMRPVKPLLINPVLKRLGLCANRLACYPPIRPPVPTLTPKPTHPSVIWKPGCSFNGGVFVYNGDTNDGGEDHIEHIGGTLGYRAQGMLRSRCLPWSLDVDVDFNSSVFDSLFLEFAYRRFLDQIGYVPGMAAHVKSSVGPFALVVEWNGAIDDATFTDDLGTDISIAPNAWQIALAYQFNWNPTVQAIGEQGTYFTIGYSESRDLAGVTQVIDGENLRVGFVPQRRFLVGVGEWVLDGLRFAVEYSHIVDYPVAEGGTGHSASGVFGMITYVW